MEGAHTSNEKIAEALKLLEEAAREKKDEMRSLVTNKYMHLKDAFRDTEHHLAQSLSDAQKRAVEAMIHAKEVSTEKAKEVATCVDKDVHDRPWPYIGGAALTGLVLGLLIGHRK